MPFGIGDRDDSLLGLFSGTLNICRRFRFFGEREAPDRNRGHDGDETAESSTHDSSREPLTRLGAKTPLGNTVKSLEVNRVCHFRDRSSQGVDAKRANSCEASIKA
jgi:hypothetical protein